MNQRLSMDRAQEVVGFLDPELQRPGQAHRSARCDGDSRASRFQRNLSRTLAEPTRRGQRFGKPRPRRRRVTFTPPALVAIC